MSAVRIHVCGICVCMHVGMCVCEEKLVRRGG